MPKHTADLALDVIKEFTRKGHTPETLAGQGEFVVMDSGIPVHYNPDTPRTVRVWDNWGVEYVDLTHNGTTWIASEPVNC